MEQVSVLLESHVMVTSFLALALMVIGIWLRLGRRGHRSIELRAESGGVVGGRDNSGPISTGNPAGAKSEQSSRDWIDVAGAIVAILGAIIAALAWFFPRIPR